MLRSVHFSVFSTVLVFALAGSGCSVLSPTGGLPDAKPLVEAVASGIADQDLSKVQLTGQPGDVATDLRVMLRTFGSTKPKIQPGAISYDAKTKTADALLSWSWPIATKPWTYETHASLKYLDGMWKFDYQPTVVHPQGSDKTRLKMVRTKPQRGRILGAGGQPLVEPRDVIHVGLDKTRLKDQADTETSVKAMATEFKLDAGEYLKQVNQAGPEAFVIAVTLRGTEVPAQLQNIPGGYGKKDRQTLGPYRGFGQPLLGTIGEASKEMADKSDGQFVQGDEVGMSGLQLLHDKTLRGSYGLTVELVAKADRPGAAGATPNSAQEITPQKVFQIEAKDGTDLKTTLDLGLQTKVEDKLKSQTVPSAAVVMQASTGRVLALAVSPNVPDQIANIGKYAPGSTFKVITSLALLRSGMTPESSLECPKELVLEGRKFQNYPEYPAKGLGTIKLRDALAYSCNTAFVNGTAALDPAAFAKAASSLGVGIDYDPQFSSFFGEVPSPQGGQEKAETSFGQGKITESPLSVTLMSASVSAGKTVLPVLIEGHELTPKAEPLSAQEAAQLKSMMGSVVDYGSLTSLKGTLVGGKTGTAEFGPDAANLKSHVWLTGYTSNDLAITVYGHEGKYGTDLAPILKGILS